MNDLLPSQMRKFRYIEDVFRKTCLKWGYEEIRTPVLEYLHLFTATGTLTPDMLSKVYSFLDWDGWSGERVVLRPDGTIPTARLFVQELKDQNLARLFYVENIFSFQAKERERWQCGVEFIGGSSPLADAELISLALEVLNGLGLKAEVRIGHIGLVKSLLSYMGIEEALDKVLIGDLKPLSSIEPELRRTFSLLFELKGYSPGFLKNFQSLLPTPLRPSLDDFLRIVELLTSLGYEYRIDMALGRGFEYYTGVVFQFFFGEEKIGGGGRYDDLIHLLSGKKMPASGFALYIEKLIKHVKDLPPKHSILILPEDRVKEAFSLAQKLRQEGYIVEIGESSILPTFTIKLKGEEIFLFNREGKTKCLTSFSQLLQALEEWGVDKISSA